MPPRRSSRRIDPEALESSPHSFEGPGNESIEETHLRLAIEQSTAEASNRRPAPPSDFDNEELNKAIRASQAEADRLDRQRAHRDDEASERESNIIAESRRLADEANARDNRQRQSEEAEVQRVLRESIAENGRRRAAEEADLEGRTASFGTGTATNRNTQSLSISSSSSPRGSSRLRASSLSTPAQTGRAPVVSSPLARPSIVINEDEVGSWPVQTPYPIRERAPRFPPTTSASRPLPDMSNSQNLGRPSISRNVDRVRELSRSASVSAYGSSRSSSSSIPTPNSSQRPRSSSLRSNTNSTSGPATRTTSISSRRNPRSQNPEDRNAPGGPVHMERAMNESRMAEINHILQTRSPSDPRYLAALASLDQVDGRAPETPNLEDTGLEDGFRPPSYPEITKDILINHRKYTTTNEGKNEAGKKKLITPAVLEQMREALATMQAAQESQPAPPSYSSATRNPLEAGVAASTADAEDPASGSLGIEESIEQTLDRGRRPRPSSIARSTRTAGGEGAGLMNAQMTLLASQDRDAWNEPFTRIPESGQGDGDGRFRRRIVPGRTGL